MPSCWGTAAEVAPGHKAPWALKLKRQGSLQSRSYRHSLSHLQRRLLGLRESPDIAVSVLPYDVMTGKIKEAEESCKKAAEEIIFGLTQWKPKESKQKREESLTFQGIDYQDAD